MFLLGEIILIDEILNRIKLNFYCEKLKTKHFKLSRTKTEYTNIISVLKKVRDN